MENLLEVERAFVHLDYEVTHKPEHVVKLWRFDSYSLKINGYNVENVCCIDGDDGNDDDGSVFMSCIEPFLLFWDGSLLDENWLEEHPVYKFHLEI